MRVVQSGFTLLELLVVIAIAAVLTGLAVPSFRASIQSAETRDAATAFYGALTTARSEAIAHNDRINVCARDLTSLNTPTCVAATASSTAWKNGWIVYRGATPTTHGPLLIHEPIADGLMLGTAASPLEFDAAGRVTTAVNYDLCRSVPDENGRRISVSRSGRVSLELRQC